MKIIAIAGLCAYFFCAQIIRAAPLSASGLVTHSTPLSLNAAWHLIESYHPVLKKQAVEKELTHHLIEQAKAKQNPELGLEATGIRRDDRELALQVGYLFENSKKRDARVGLAVASAALVSAGNKSEAQALQMQVKQAFLRVQLAQAEYALADKIAGESQVLVDIATKRMQAGDLSPVDVNKVLLAQYSYFAEKSISKQKLEAAKQSLSLLWGEVAPRFDAVSSLPEISSIKLDVDAVLGSLPSSPWLLPARANKLREEAVLVEERVRNSIDWRVNAGVKYQVLSGKPQPFVGVSFTLPWFDKNHAGVAAQALKVSQAQIEVQQAEMAQKQLLYQAMSAWQQAKANIDLLDKESLVLANKNLQAARYGFAEGKFGVLDVLDAGRSLLSLEQYRLRAEADAWHALLELQRHIPEAEFLHLKKD